MRDCSNNQRQGSARSLLQIPGVMLFAIFLSWNATTAAADSDNPQLSGTTDRGVYHVSIYADSGAVPVGQFHDWAIRVRLADGDTFIPSQLMLMAGMPAHGHGLTTMPLVTRYRDDGSFLVEGVKFNMTGLWNIVVNVTGPLGPDTISFDMTVRDAPVAMPDSVNGWTEDEYRALVALSIDSLPPPYLDESNRLSRNPKAIQLGKELFSDKKLSRNDDISCATCHDPDRYFTDGRKLSFGSRQTARHSPSLLGSAYSPWFYWDGRRDSMWSQALTPIETIGEMDGSRVDTVRFVVKSKQYGELFSKMSGSISRQDIDDLSRFPTGASPFSDTAAKKAAWAQMSSQDQVLINRAFSDIGKILAAYVETLQHRPSRFDRYVRELREGRTGQALSENEIAGLKIFINADKVPCLRCHNGPLFTNQEFQNIATGFSSNGSFDFGRSFGLYAARANEFNCRSTYSDVEAEKCSLLRHVSEGHADQGAFKVPGLRNIGETGPYMHDGRFDSLEEVIGHYLNAHAIVDVLHEVPRFELSDEEVSQLVSFLHTLTDEGGDNN